MSLHTLAAQAKQSFEELYRLRDPDRVADWAPTAAQRSRFIQLAESLLEARDGIDRIERRHLQHAPTQPTRLPEPLIRFLRDELEPRATTIRQALDTLDPDGALLRKLLLDWERPPTMAVKATFEQGIEQIYNLEERNPDQDFGFVPDTACEILDSPLLRFDPDAWLDRITDLSPMRSDKANFTPPVQVRFRLEELYRAHIFGLSLSVFALARSLLEYALLDNCNKLGIRTSWDNGRDKKLSHLIDEAAVQLPGQTSRMALIRDLGNEYLHPTRTRTRGEQLLQRDSQARKVIAALVPLIEALYLAKSSGLDPSAAS